MMKALVALFLLWTVLTLVSCLTFESNMAENDVVDVAGVTAKGRRQYVIVARNSTGDRVLRIYIQGVRRRIQVGYGGPIFSNRLIAPNTAFQLALRLHGGRLEIRMFDSRSSDYVFIQTEVDLKGNHIHTVRGSSGIARFRKAKWEDYVGTYRNCGQRIRLGEHPAPGVCPVVTPYNNERIVGGTPAALGAHPWQVSLWEKRRGEEEFKARCGGILIGNCWVMTAAHCIYGDPENYRVRVGDYYILDDKRNREFSDYEDTQELEIKKIISHQDYWTVPTSRNDIVLLRLKSANPDGTCVTFGPLVQPACLPTGNMKFLPGTLCDISGWGATQESQSSDEYPPCLQQASVRLISNSACKQEGSGYPDLPGYGPRILDTMLCSVGNGATRSDACQGDSGGPLVCDQASTAIVWGVTSWGEGCGTHYGVYTRVAKFLPWVEHHMLKAVKYKPSA